MYSWAFQGLSEVNSTNEKGFKSSTKSPPLRCNQGVREASPVLAGLLWVASNNVTAYSTSSNSAGMANRTDAARSPVYHSIRLDLWGAPNAINPSEPSAGPFLSVTGSIPAG